MVRDIYRRILWFACALVACFAATGSVALGQAPTPAVTESSFPASDADSLEADYEALQKAVPPVPLPPGLPEFAASAEGSGRVIPTDRLDYLSSVGSWGSEMKRRCPWDAVPVSAVARRTGSGRFEVTLSVSSQLLYSSSSITQPVDFFAPYQDFKVFTRYWYTSPCSLLMKPEVRAEIWGSRRNSKGGGYWEREPGTPSARYAYPPSPVPFERFSTAEPQKPALVTQKLSMKFPSGRRASDIPKRRYYLAIVASSRWKPRPKWAGGRTTRDITLAPVKSKGTLKVCLLVKSKACNGVTRYGEAVRD